MIQFTHISTQSHEEDPQHYMRTHAHIHARMPHIRTHIRTNVCKHTHMYAYIHTHNVGFNDEAL